MTEKPNPSPIITLWYKPGQTLQGLIASGKGGAEAVFFGALFGVVQVWPAYFGNENGSLALLLLGALVAIAGLYFFSWLLRNFSRWFGGQASLAEVRVALGWGLLPWVALFGILFVLIASTGADPQKIFPLVFAAIIYGFVVLLLALSSALRLTFMKTFFCFILTVLFSIFPLTLIMQLILGVG